MKMNKKEWKDIQGFVEGKDLDVQVLRKLVRKQLTELTDLQNELNEHRVRNTKLDEHNNFLHKLLLESANEKALLINEKNHLREQIKNQTIGAREQRLIKVAKMVIKELDAEGSTHE